MHADAHVHLDADAHGELAAGRQLAGKLLAADVGGVEPAAKVVVAARRAGRQAGRGGVLLDQQRRLGGARRRAGIPS